MQGFEFCPSLRAVLGCVFVNMPWRYLGQYIELIKENTINIELGFAADDLESFSADVVCATIGQVREQGSRITVHGPFWDLCPGSADPEIRKVTATRLESLFDLVEKIRPEQVVCHTGFDPRHHRGLWEQWIENSVSTWMPFVRRAEMLKIPLVLENVFEESPQFHLDLLKAVSSPWLGICLDVGHQQSFSRTTLEKWLQAVWPYLKEIHLHDNDGSSDAHLPIGMGTIDFELLFSFLGQRRISPALTLEPHTFDHLRQTLAGLAATASFRQFAAGEIDGKHAKGVADGDSGTEHCAGRC
jgi:sugar phosphate isomerase/epimerase